MRGIYIAIGNPDDPADVLPQDQWALFVSRARYHLSTYCTFAQVAFLGEWQTTCDAGRQSVCWLVELSDDSQRVDGLVEALAACAGRFNHKPGVTWAPTDIEVIKAVPA